MGRKNKRRQQRNLTPLQPEASKTLSLADFRSRMMSSALLADLGLEDLGAELADDYDDAPAEPEETEPATPSDSVCAQGERPNVAGYPRSGRANVITYLKDSDRLTRNTAHACYVRPQETAQVIENMVVTWNPPTSGGILSIHEVEVLLAALMDQMYIYQRRLGCFCFKLIFRPTSGGVVDVLQFRSFQLTRANRYNVKWNELLEDSLRWARRFFDERRTPSIFAHGCKPYFPTLGKRGGVYHDEWLQIAHLEVESGNFIASYQCSEMLGRAEHVENMLATTIALLAKFALLREERQYYISFPDNDNLQDLVVELAREFNTAYQSSRRAKCGSRVADTEGVSEELRDYNRWVRDFLDERPEKRFWIA